MNPKIFLPVLTLFCCLQPGFCTDAAPPPAPAAVTSPAATVAPSPQTIQAVAASIRQALVRIEVVSGTTEGGRETRSTAFGSGVIIDPAGYIITNHHVAGNARWLSVTLADKREVEAKLVGTDALSDLSVIKIEGGPYPVAPWGDDTKLQVGDPVLALGSPLAFSESVTAGIVSNTELVMPDLVGKSLTMDGENVGTIVRWIAHDAAIYPGNSGGALINLQGQIVGINEISMGLSGAIPAHLARLVAAALIADGGVHRAYTGLELQPRLRGDARRAGVLVAGVLPASPAQKAGIMPGDLLLKTKTSAGEQSFDVAFDEQLPPLNGDISMWPVGSPVNVTLQRAGAERTVELTPTARPRALAQEREVAGWDLTASDITPLMALEGHLPGTSGVSITGVANGGAAASAEPPIEDGDVLTSLGGKPVTDMASFKSLAEAVPHVTDGTPILVELWRDGQTILSVAHVNRTNQSDSSSEVAKAWLPIETQVLTKTLATALKLPTGTMGVRVTRLLDPTLSLKVGDVLTKLDSDAIEATNPEDTDTFPAMLREYKIGSWTKVTLLRAGKPLVSSLKLAASPRPERELPTYRDQTLGLTMRDISFFDKSSGNVEKSLSGVYVSDVTEGGWAALAGLTNGTVILQVNGTPVQSLTAAKAALAVVETTHEPNATLFVANGVHTQYLDVKTGLKPVA